MVRGARESVTVTGSELRPGPVPNSVFNPRNRINIEVSGGGLTLFEIYVPSPARTLGRYAKKTAVRKKKTARRAVQ